ncbi:M23 family metallopeptidase [Curtobacterium flaccumfaciens pv. oortii]|uniref:M23 family metallopeptidase n=1 Tax=Curtobacterium flaccumfaciens TaxID=2035 RepID=UPI001BDE3E98|nr:peptidoglycan DD-metalloendopeptidase family protein [Curtobacterium flaccumfaciens]MBT1623177.1 M23 family metallopeptidase [Curtobacterium flaccumfaciens pv. oortii]
MTTPTDGLPLRPRGAERRAANRSTTRRPEASVRRRAGHGMRPDGPRAAGVTVSPPVTPASTSFFRSSVRRALPATATAAVTCLFVAVGSPQTAMASTPSPSGPVLGVQQFVADGSARLSVDRDGFSIGRAAAQARATVVGSSGASARPTEGSTPAAGGFGSRWVTGCSACSTNHHGIDFAAPIGTAVVAAMPGSVVSAGALGGYGNQVLLQHADGTQTRYGHLSTIGVRPGQVLSAGQRLGAVGNTGVSTGAHLHFEVIVDGVPVDPATWLQARGLL